MYIHVSLHTGQLESDVSIQNQILSAKDAELRAAREEVNLFSFFPLHNFWVYVRETELLILSFRLWKLFNFFFPDPLFDALRLKFISGR